MAIDSDLFFPLRMVIFHSYAKLPEGISSGILHFESNLDNWGLSSAY